MGTLNTELDNLENDSLFIIREAYAKSKHLAMLWSMGKDSTVMLHLVRKAFLGRCPIPVIHIDTSYKIEEMIAWRDDYARRHNLPLLIGVNQDALAQGTNPSIGRLACCNALKTQALLKVIRDHNIQALLVGIRGDEDGSRGKERVVSPRDDSGLWQYRQQPTELWHHYNLHLPPAVHLRVHPLLRWTELDVWQYIRREKLEIMSLYFAKGGKRYRSLGCQPCTATIESTASTVEEIIDELRMTKVTERAGRAQDKADTYAMQKLRSTGYM